MNELLNYVLKIDYRIFLYLNNLGIKKYDFIWIFISNKYFWCPMYLFIIFFIYKKYSKLEFIIILCIMFIMITFSDQSCNFIKLYFKRFRPGFDYSVNEVFRAVGYSKGTGTYGFISAHACNTMTIFVFLYNVLNKKINSSNFLIFIILLFTYVILVGYSRIYLGLHYPLDIIGGYTLGTLYGLTFYRFFILLKHKILV